MPPLPPHLRYLTIYYAHIYTYKRAVCVCLSVCLLFIGHTTFVHFAALPPSGRESRISRRRERLRARGQAHAQREQAHACRTTSQRKNRCADAFQKQNRTRAHPVVYVSAEIFKKKTNMPLPKFSLQFDFSWSVYFRIVLNRILHKSSLLAPMESRRTRRPTFTAEERLERRREQDRRRHAERRARERREQTQARRDVERLRCSQARA